MLLVYFSHIFWSLFTESSFRFFFSFDYLFCCCCWVICALTWGDPAALESPQISALESDPFPRIQCLSEVGQWIMGHWQTCEAVDTHTDTHICAYTYTSVHTHTYLCSLSLFISLNQKSPHCIDFSDFCFPSTWQTHHYPSTQRWSQCLTLCFMVEFIETQTQAIVQSSQALYPWVMPTTLNVCLNNSITEQTLMLRIDPPEEKLEIRLSMKILPPIPPLLFLEMWNICNNERCLLYRLPPICFLLCCS